MKRLPMQSRTLALLAVTVPLLALFIYVGLRSGPLAPVAVTVTVVDSRAVSPTLFGVGTVEARYLYKIGPTFAGRVKRMEVHVGDRVNAEQLLAEMEPIDLDDRIRSQESVIKRTEAALREAKARHTYARTQAHRYEQLFAVHTISEETISAKRQELQIADAVLSSAREELARARSDHKGLLAQRNNLRLVSPVDGVVAERNADSGTTVLAGQSLIEIIDPKSFWVNVRFNQTSSTGLTAGLPASIVLRSRSGQMLDGHVLRVEPKADAVTEETLAKVTFANHPDPFPPMGELAEVTVALPTLPLTPVIPNAAVRRVGERVGVWQIVEGELRFSPVELGVSDPDGYVQVHKGLKNGERIVVYSEKSLAAHSHIYVVDHIPGVL